MSNDIGKLYKIRKKEVSKAGAVLADAFQHDPVWSKVLEDASMDQRCAFFEGAVRYCLKYGEVYASSENLEGVAIWIPGDLADMTFWRWLRSGSLFAGMKFGMKMTMLSLKMKPIFEPLESDRKANMKGREYIYFMILGVATEYQGKGFGGRLIRALIVRSEKVGIPIYVETASEGNVRMYERSGFRILKKITLPIIDLPQWEMVREPIN